MMHECFPPLPDAHPFGCDCDTCEPHKPSVPLFQDSADITALWCLAGVPVGSAIAFAINHAGAARALVHALTLGWR